MSTYINGHLVAECSRLPTPTQHNDTYLPDSAERSVKSIYLQFTFNSTRKRLRIVSISLDPALKSTKLQNTTSEETKKILKVRNFPRVSHDEWKLYGTNVGSRHSKSNDKLASKRGAIDVYEMKMTQDIASACFGRNIRSFVCLYV